MTDSDRPINPAHPFDPFNPRPAHFYRNRIDKWIAATHAVRKAGDLPKPPQPKCLVCQEPAKLTCDCDMCGTVVFLNYQRVQKAQYCSEDCQDKHWEEHDEDNILVEGFVADKQLERAAHFLFCAFEMLKMHVYDVPIQTVTFTTQIKGQGEQQYEEERMIVEEARYTDSERVLYDFPQHIVKNMKAQHPDIESRLLSFLSYTDHMTMMYPLVEFILKGSGIVKAIREVYFKIAPTKKPYTFRRDAEQIGDCRDPREDNSNTMHSVYRVKLYTGAEWALDLGSAQFGYNQVLIPWKVFLEERVAASPPNTEHKFGATRQFVWDERRMFQNGQIVDHAKDEMNAKLIFVKVQVARAIKEAVEKGLIERDYVVDACAAVPEVSVRRFLLQTLDWRFDEIKGELLSDGLHALRHYLRFMLDDHGHMTPASAIVMRGALVMQPTRNESTQVNTVDRQTSAENAEGHNDDGHDTGDNSKPADDQTDDYPEQHALSESDKAPSDTRCETMRASDDGNAEHEITLEPQIERTLEEAEESRRQLLEEVDTEKRREEEKKARDDRKREKKRQAKKNSKDKKKAQKASEKAAEEDTAQGEEAEDRKAEAFEEEDTVKDAGVEDANTDADKVDPGVEKAEEVDGDGIEAEQPPDVKSDSSSGDESGLPRDNGPYKFSSFNANLKYK